MTRTSSLRAAVLGAAALVVLVGLAPTPVTVTDNFNNNAINQNLWDSLSFGGKNIAETNQRL